jgi:hypothetical protein
MRVQPRAPTPDEELFYQEWLGPLWLRYRTRFGSDPPGPPIRFEWHSALYPLWLAAPRLWRPLAVVVAIVAAAVAVLMLDPRYTPAADVIGTAIATVVVLCWWPVVPAISAVALLAGELSTSLALLLALMVVVSTLLGALTPRWIVAAGRRRWYAHQAATTAASAPPIRAVREPSAAVAVLLMMGSLILMQAVRGPNSRGHSKERAYVAAMKSDLRLLGEEQHAFLADSGRYAASVDQLDTEASVGVTLRIEEASETGWSAIATHIATRMHCGIFVGTAAAAIAEAAEGEPRCTPRPR